MRRGKTGRAWGLGQGKIGVLSSLIHWDGEREETDGGWGGAKPQFPGNPPPGSMGRMVYDNEWGKRGRGLLSTGNTTRLTDWNQRIEGETGHEARLDLKCPFFCATSGRNRHSSTVGGILASISKAASRVAIQAHLPEEGGWEWGREGGKQGERADLWEEEGGGVACSQSVTEIERFHERERDTEKERESTKQRWGPSTEIGGVGRTEICTQTWVKERKEEERGGWRRAGGGGKRGMQDDGAQK